MIKEKLITRIKGTKREEMNPIKNIQMGEDKINNIFNMGCLIVIIIVICTFIWGIWPIIGILVLGSILWNILNDF